MAYFASVADYSYVNRHVASARRFATSLPVEGLYTIKERWQHWLTLSRSDLILIIGNERIRNSFEAHNDGHHEISLVDCGVDTVHYTPLPASVRRPVFIHCVTRFSVRKGSHIVAEAWRKIADKCLMPLLFFWS